MLIRFIDTQGVFFFNSSVFFFLVFCEFFLAIIFFKQSEMFCMICLSRVFVSEREQVVTIGII